MQHRVQLATQTKIELGYFQVRMDVFRTRVVTMRSCLFAAGQSFAVIDERPQHGNLLRHASGGKVVEAGDLQFDIKHGGLFRQTVGHRHGDADLHARQDLIEGITINRHDASPGERGVVAASGEIADHQQFQW